MLIGHQATIQRLWGALERDSLHHALLFEGAPGIGKRRLALRLAQAANCEAEVRPCEKCRSCGLIATGNHPDVIMVVPDPEKATATIGVDQIREVVRQSGYHRYNAKKRFIIIDPAEAMQASAANALLKTLEEPPAGTGFILLATHARALLPTILSRCQRHRLAPVTEKELVIWLSGQGIDNASVIARMAEGRPGRALELAQGSLTERAEFRAQALQAMAGSLKETFQFSEALCKGAGRQDWVPKVERLLELFEDLLRDTTILASGLDAPLLNADLQPVLEKWVDALWPGGISACAEAIHEARENLQANVGGRTVVDALLARIRTELGAARKAVLA